MNLTDKDYILGYWFADDDDGDCWYMMIIKRDDKWLGQYTFRYHQEEGRFNPFSGKDKKNVYSLSFPGKLSEVEVLDSASEVFRFVTIKYNHFSDHFLVQGNIEKFMKISKTKSYVHMKTMKLHS